MSDKMSLEKVLRKLAKLKKLYEGAKKINSEGEANNAAVLIQKLLTEYNLTMDEIETEDEKKSDLIHEQLSGYEYKSIGGYWELMLTKVVCDYNFCRCFKYGNSYKNILIIGSKDNIENCKWLVKFLKETFVKLSNVRYKEYCENSMMLKQPTKDKFQRSYLMGCTQGLRAKFKEEKEEREKAEKEKASRITALTVRNNEAVDKYVEQKWGGYGSGRSFSVKYDAANAMGVMDGKNTTINKQLKG